MRAALATVAVLAIGGESLGQSTPPIAVRRPPPPPASSAAQDAVSNVVQVRPGYASHVQLTEPFAQVIVGDPDLIDAVATTDRSLVVRARKGAPGGSNIILVNNNGQQIHNLHVRVVPEIRTADDGGGTVKVHGGGPGRFAIYEFAAYSCTPDGCARLPQNQERIRDPRRDIIMMPGLTPEQLVPLGDPR